MNKIKKLVVFPNDSILDYYKKGEIKDRYFNPLNWFDQIDVISLFDDEIDEDKIQKLAGTSTLKIHKIGKVNLSNYKSYETELTSLILKINPIAIRAFNPRIQGWLATKIGKKLKIPVIISLHTNYSQQTQLAKKQKKIFQYVKLKYSSSKIEKFVLQNCDAVICVYEYILPYAKNMGAKNIHIIYNRINLSTFSSSLPKKFHSSIPVIISVGQLIEQKNRIPLIKAMKGLDAKLLIIGDGIEFQNLSKLVNSLNLTHQIEFIKKIPNDELPNYYNSCMIFALPLENLDGIPIPFFEAMSCGLPVVTTKHSDEFSEITDKVVSFVSNSPESFHYELKRILSDYDYREKLRHAGFELVKTISGSKMEQKELDLYKKLIKLT